MSGAKRASRKTQVAEFTPPEGYPIPREKLPGIVGNGLRAFRLDIFHLMHFGKVTAEDYAKYGWRPMRCGDCQERILELHFNHPPLSLEDFSTLKILPGCIWGTDVSPVCACCSFPSTCPHKTSRRGENGTSAAEHAQTAPATDECENCGADLSPRIQSELTRLRAENAHLKLLLLAGLHTAGEETRSDGNGRVSLAHAEEVTVPPEVLKHPAARGLGEWVEACCEVFRADFRKAAGIAK